MITDAAEAVLTLTLILAFAGACGIVISLVEHIWKHVMRPRDIYLRKR